MIILAHRNYWKQPIEKNKIISFERSFSLKFGVETDIRDYNGDLMISQVLPIHWWLLCYFFFCKNYLTNWSYFFNPQSDFLNS